ncbi:FHA domain-containing protein [Streptomyces sp. N50]|uniref:FHA domain-containing protein n=1 Tax=Streptomyces sp. N50 TaxID=3081765 RepID=UPI002961EFDF|nr:FHA domain-containing protein [Streptomyces sp. N50]WOX07924.1 FHA domain-containing protein [Streptomyces sp. N50]
MTDPDDDDSWDSFTPLRPGTPRAAPAGPLGPDPGHRPSSDADHAPQEVPEDDEPWDSLTPVRPGAPRPVPAGAPAAVADDPPDGLVPRRPDEAPAADDRRTAEPAAGRSRPAQGPPRLVRCPGCARKVPARAERCPACSAPVSDADPGPVGEAGVSAVLRFSGGLVQLRLRPGEVRALGRDPDWAPTTARGFADEHSVSRRHAEVALRADGTLWVTEYQDGTTHGTRVNGDYVLPAVPRPLADGDRLVLGLHSEAIVSLCAPGERAPD